MASQTLRVQGYRELSRAFSFAEEDLNRKLKASLRDVAEPVRVEAERLAVRSLKVGKIPWSEMRVGVTGTGVYVAPKRRRTVGTRRKDFAAFLLGTSMEPALEANQGRVVDAFEEVLDDVANLWGRGG